MGLFDYLNRLRSSKWKCNSFCVQWRNVYLKHSEVTSVWLRSKSNSLQCSYSMDNSLVVDVHSKVFADNVFLKLKSRHPFWRWWTSLQSKLNHGVSRIQGYNPSIDNYKDGFFVLGPAKQRHVLYNVMHSKFVLFK